MDNNERRRIQQEIKELLQPPETKQRENSPLALHSFYITAIVGVLIIGTGLGTNANFDENNTQATTTSGKSNTEFEPMYYVDGTAISATAMNFSDIPDIEVELAGI